MVIQLPDEQKARIEALAHERGYENAADYLLALVNVDAEENILSETSLTDDFRQSWHEAMTGQTRSAREALADLRRKLGRDGDPG